MKTSNLYRQVPGLLAGVTLFVISFLFSGCNTGADIRQDISPKKLFGPDLQQLPVIVLAVTGNEYEFNWDKTTIGGAPVLGFVPKKKFWRVNVFKDDLQIGGNDSDFHSFEGKRSETFRGLPRNELLRVDLDLTDNPEGDPNAKSLSFLVLLKEDWLIVKE